MTSPVSIPAGHKLLGTDFDAYENLTAAWQSWSPSLGNLTQGDGSLTSVYRWVSKTFDYDFYLRLGATSTVGTNPGFSLPTGVTPAARYTAVNLTAVLGNGFIFDSSGDVSRLVIGRWFDTGIIVYFYNATPTHTTITSTVPWTWATGDVIHISGTLELA